MWLNNMQNSQTLGAMMGIEEQKQFQGYMSTGAQCRKCKYMYRYTKIKLKWCEWPFKWHYQCRYNKRVKFEVGKNGSCKMFKIKEK